MSADLLENVCTSQFEGDEYGWLERQVTGHHNSQVTTGHYRSIMYFQQKLT